MMTSKNMNCKPQQRLFRVFCVLCAFWLLASCASEQKRVPARVADKNTVPPEVAVEIFELEPEKRQASVEVLDQRPSDTQEIKLEPWKLLAKAKQVSGPQRYDMMLDAAEQFLEKRYLSTAIDVLNDLNTQALAPDQKHSQRLLTARHALLSNDIDRAIQLLNASKGALYSVDTVLKRRWLSLDISVSHQQGAYLREVESRILLDSLLDRPLSNQRQIIQAIQAHPQSFKAVLLQPASYLSGWVELAALLGRSPPDSKQLSDWQFRHSKHTARVQSLRLAVSRRNISNKVALILPMSSSLGEPSLAFLKGFRAAEKDAGKINASVVYDIGSEAAFASLYYKRALADGADFIIGPLGKKNVEALIFELNQPNIKRVPTIILGDLTGQLADVSSLWGLALAPEQDAQAVAERAVKNGYRHALVLQKNNPWGRRVSAAFKQAFIARGGKVVGSQSFEPSSSNHSVSIKNLLSINASDVRHRRLQSVLGQKIKSSVRRRDDVDFIFIAGSANDARRLVPLVKFYRAHDLPLFATSGAHSGAFDKFKDQDLNGLVFPDLPWVMSKLKSKLVKQQQPSNILTVAPSSENLSLPYQRQVFNRLYALGYAAFELIPQLGLSSSDSRARLDTKTMQLYLGEKSNLLHKVAWGKYTSNGVKSVQ